MDYKERVLEKIAAIEQRTEEKEGLWRSISESFEEKGADGVTEQLAAQMGEIKGRFNAVLSKLDGML